MTSLPELCAQDLAPFMLQAEGTPSVSWRWLRELGQRAAPCDLTGRQARR